MAMVESHGRWQMPRRSSTANHIQWSSIDHFLSIYSMHTCHVHVHVHAVNIAAAAADVLCWLYEADTERYSRYREPATTPLSST
eukprot:scaffold10363_cov113-Skeletonema_dohrnii-CCMP3373.AAC.1